MGKENNENRNLEYAGRKDLFITGFDTKVLIECPMCHIKQYRKLAIHMSELEHQKRLLNFKCETHNCNFKSTFLFYFGLELT